MVLPQLSGCPVYQFKPNITFADSVIAPAVYGIKVPPGLPPTSVPAPKFIDATTMNSMLNSEPGGHGRYLHIVHGLTVNEVTVTFPNPEQQWRQVRTGAAQPSWQFQGGDVLFNSKISVYVLDGDKPQPDDDRTRQIFAIIMEHELLHVLDEIDIVSRWMPSEAYKDDKVLKYLSNAEPVDNSMYEYWFRGGHFSKYLTDALWAPEHDNRRQVRDSAHQYAALGEQIDELRRSIINSPPPQRAPAHH